MLKKIESGIFFIFVILLLMLVFNRIHYGVDLTDEAYSSAIPYRFALGDTPFIDELSPQQTSSFILFPIIKIYTLLFGTEFLILFMRHMYLLFTMVVAFIIYKTINEHIGGKLSLLISLMVVLYAPFSVIFFNYNRLAYLMFSAGCFMGILKRDKLFWSGILHGFTIIAYPFFAIPCAIFFLIQLFRYRSFKNVHYIYGSLIPLSAFLAIALYIGFDKLLDMAWSLRLGIHGGGIDKFINVFLGIWHQIHYKKIILIYCVAVFALFKKYKQASTALLIILLIPFFAFKIPNPSAPSWYFIFYGLFAPYLMLFVKKEDDFLRSIFSGIWIPSFIAGITTGLISANGSINFGIGIVPGALVTSIILVCIIKEGASDFHNYISVFIPASILIILLVFQYSFVYSEGSYLKLSEKIEYGPYRGLYTSLEKKQYLDSIIQDFDKFNLDKGKVLFFDFFPAGYLFTTMRPASNLVWSVSPQLFDTDRDLALRYYDNKSNLPDVSVKINLVYTYTGGTLRLEYSENDALVAFVRQVNNKIYKGKYCDIYYSK
jgi:hypothetical protein